jgi:serine/threonine protein kinase
VAYSSIGPYQITRPLGQGGMGAVYEAISPDQGHRVAIKVLHARHTHSTEAVARFFNEAKAVNLIGHEGLVKITEHGHLPDGSAYLVMEYLAGDNLAIHLHRQGRMSERDVLRVAGQLASVLAATHAAGIVHRDLKPGNVMLVPDNSVADGERVKLLDFGIAKLSLPVGSGAAPMTHVGAMLGTPQYMSPEQCRGSAQLDGRSDVYSLGIMMFQMLAGQLPFETPGSEMGVVALHLLAPVPSLLPLAPQTRPALAQLVERMLAKAKEERPSMAEVVEASARAGCCGAGAVGGPGSLGDSGDSGRAVPADRAVDDDGDQSQLAAFAKRAATGAAGSEPATLAAGRRGCRCGAGGHRGGLAAARSAHCAVVESGPG